MQPFLNAYPLPNGPEILDQNGNPTGTASFNTTYSNRSTLDAASLRLDHKLNDKLTLFGRYNYAPSELVTRGGSGLRFEWARHNSDWDANRHSWGYVGRFSLSRE